MSVCHESNSGRENNVYLYTAETVCMLFGNLVISKLFFNHRNLLLPAATKLGQGNIFTGVCLSTGGMGVCLSAWWDIPPWEQTPPQSRHHPPPEQTTLRSRHPLGADTSPREQTPPPGSRHPPKQTPPRSRHPPLGADTPQSRHPPRS